MTAREMFTWLGYEQHNEITTDEFIAIDMQIRELGW